jgi:hypothetical protein
VIAAQRGLSSGGISGDERRHRRCQAYVQVIVLPEPVGIHSAKADGVPARRR